MSIEIDDVTVVDKGCGSNRLRLQLVEVCICCSEFFISGNFYFSFVPTSLAYITITQNKRKTKIT